MKAIQYRSYGDYSENRLVDLPQPALRDGEVLVAIRTVGINPLDNTFRSGHFYGATPENLPRIGGQTRAGAVVASKSDALNVGNRVFVSAAAANIAKPVQSRQKSSGSRPNVGSVVRRVQQTLDSIPVAAWRARADGFVEYFNKRWLDYAGASLDQVLGWQWAGSFHPEDLPRVNDIWLQLLASGKSGEIEARMRRHDGSYRWFLARAEPLRDDTGRVVAWYGTNMDIEDRTQALARLQEMESDFAHMNRVSVMGELAASLSHEILHPIATARNNAWAGMRFLEMSPPNLDKAKVAFGCVIRDADRANDIVGRMRDQIKKAPPRKESFGLNEAINEVVDMVRSSIAKNGIAVSAHLMDGLVPVWGDRVQLQQVVVNLILNAIDAMSSVENGPRELSIRTEQSQTGGVLVAVHDSGPGIEQENFERVFEPFSTTKSSGIGMGLAICRSIINGHGGRLWVAANEPWGAVFQFTLPAQEDS